MGNMNWATPQYVIDTIETAFGRKIDLDVAASPHNAKATNYFTLYDDELKRLWFGDLVFCNPPYQNIRKWTSKAQEEWKEGRAKDIIMLLPSRTGSQWFHDVHFCTDRVGFIPGRIAFIDPLGLNRSAPAHDSLIVHFGLRPMAQNIALDIAYTRNKLK